MYEGLQSSSRLPNAGPLADLVVPKARIIPLDCILLAGDLAANLDEGEYTPIEPIGGVKFVDPIYSLFIQCCPVLLGTQRISQPFIAK